MIHQRPLPPDRLGSEADGPDDVGAAFVPAPELRAWVDACFLDSGGALYNPEHEALKQARILYLWTNVPKHKHGRRIWAETRLVRASGDKWTNGAALQQIREWAGGELPDFLIIFDAVVAHRLADASFCATVDHELYHCAAKLDETGMPELGDEGAGPKWEIRGHDVEEFVGVARRWGARAAGIEEFIAAALAGPTIAAAEIAIACGTCR